VSDSGSVLQAFRVSRGEVYIRHNFICQMLLEADQFTVVPQRISEHIRTHVHAEAYEGELFHDLNKGSI